MTTYSFLTSAEADKIFQQFPKINAETLTEQVNDLFTPYLFYHRERKDRISLWSSCCRRHGSMDKLPRTIGPVEAGVIFGKHNDKVICPYCGREVTLKNTAQLGKKKNLLEYQPVVFLSEKDGDLYARCYWARKDYQKMLNDPPLFMNTFAMHFSIGKSEIFYEEWVSNNKLTIKHGVVEGNYDPVHRIIHEPFIDGAWYYGPRYVPYYIFGLDEIAKSNFKYCQFESFEIDKCDHAERRLYSDMCKYLAAYSIYPRQIEMLMKTGGKDLVCDLVSGRKKNKNIIKWKADNPYDAFGLDKIELREFRVSGCEIYAIEDYKKLRRNNLRVSFACLYEIESSMGAYMRSEIVKTCISRGIAPDKLLRYLSKFTGARCYGGYYSIGNAYRDWNDYVVLAEGLGYDLGVETVLMPRNLDLAHEEARQELDLKLKREADQHQKELSEKVKLGILQRMRKYNIEMDGYFIRIAESPEEIVAEGKTLVHCVGGYAERHMSGQTTILFLRRIDAPDVSLYTIQMNGDTIAQIHGYKNERLESGRSAPNPRETMRWLLDPWIEWLKKGSPRREDGTARIPKYKEAKSA